MINPTPDERITNALACARDTSSSPAMALSRVMAALGYDFGDPDTVEHQVMQYYADPAVNPFVQAQIEAKILLDAGELERLAQFAKNREAAKSLYLDVERKAGFMKEAVFDAIYEQQEDSHETFLKHIATVFAVIVNLGLRRYGVNAFNAALSDAIDILIKEDISDEPVFPEYDCEFPDR